MSSIKQKIRKNSLGLGTNTKFWFVNEKGVVVCIEKASDKRGDQSEA